MNFFGCAIGEKYIDDYFQAAEPVIEHQKRARNHEQHLGQPKFILMREWNFGFEKVDRLIADKSDSAASEARQLRVRHELIKRHQSAQFVKRIAGCFESLFAAVLDDSDVAPVALHNRARIHAHERKTSRNIVLFRGLKKKTVTAA